MTPFADDLATLSAVLGTPKVDWRYPHPREGQALWPFSEAMSVVLYSTTWRRRLSGIPCGTGEAASGWWIDEEHSAADALDQLVPYLRARGVTVPR